MAIGQFMGSNVNGWATIFVPHGEVCQQTAHIVVELLDPVVPVDHALRGLFALGGVQFKAHVADELVEILVVPVKRQTHVRGLRRKHAVRNTPIHCIIVSRLAVLYIDIVAAEWQNVILAIKDEDVTVTVTPVKL